MHSPVSGWFPVKVSGYCVIFSLAFILWRSSGGDWWDGLWWALRLSFSFPRERVLGVHYWRQRRRETVVCHNVRLQHW